MGRPVLRVEERTVRVVDHQDMDKFIQEVSGYSFESAADLEARNDSSHEIHVRLNEYNPSNYDREVWANQKSGKNPPGLRSILACMCEEGFIPEGFYLIRVSW